MWITKIARTAFRIVGVAYWGVGGLVPFELEFYFDKRRDVKPTRVIARVGELDHNGSIRVHSNSKLAARIAKYRPTRDCDWAVAVELTGEI